MDNQEMTKAEWVSPNEPHIEPCPKLQAAQADLRAAEAKYRPATLAEAIELLTPCLILCAPSGMQEADRTAWYKAALMTIGDIPLSFLHRATAEARKACDHPAKIVPFICKYETEAVRWANENLRHARARFENLNAPRIEKHEPEYMTAEDLAEMKAELARGLSADRPC
jgi:hypothetical protein